MASDSAPRRLHPASIIFNLVREARALAVPALLLIFGTRSESRAAFFAAAVTAAGALVAMGVSIARYLSFTYAYEEDELVVRWGLFFKHERHIPYDRIQNVDATQNIVHALIDVYAVAIETASGTEAEATLSVLPASALSEMRRRIFEERGAVASAPADAGAAPSAGAEILLHLGLRDLAICGLVRGRGLLALAAVFSLLADLVGDFGFDEKVIETAGDTQRRGPIVRAVRAFVSGLSLDPWHILAAGIVFLVLIAIVRALSTLYTMQRLFDFTLRLSGGELLISFGLLTRVKATIPLRRIQALTVREGPLHRLFGVCSVRADTAGGPTDLEAARMREWLAPIIRRGELQAFIARVMPGADLDAVAWQPAHPRAFRRVILKPLLLALAASAALVWALGVRAAFPSALLVGAVFLNARLRVKHMGHSLDGGVFVCKSGWFWRHVRIAPVGKVQAVAMHESPFDRRHGMATLIVDTAGATTARNGVGVPYLPRATASALSMAIGGSAAQSPLSW
jgi:putative membrane protein